MDKTLTNEKLMIPFIHKDSKKDVPEWQKHLQNFEGYIYGTNGISAIRTKGTTEEARFKISEFNANVMESFFEKGKYVGTLVMSEFDAPPLHKKGNIININDVVCIHTDLLKKLLPFGENAKVFQSIFGKSKKLIFVFNDYEIVLMPVNCRKEFCSAIHVKLVLHR